ncbi:hypothetical protein SEEGA711_08141 [Salmonella enterica subsp. enterica serovar Gaminara str. ATCC BAA-711]|nr:hypothetical protein SEEGA711_08141 [Salmonella enterica subsp. enterica serovar Gaminara str. ATCC BAA-711]
MIYTQLTELLCNYKSMLFIADKQGIFMFYSFKSYYRFLKH